MAVGTTVSIANLVVTNATLTGSIDQVITESGTANTVPPLKEAYNARVEASIEGIDDGFTAGNTFSAKSLTFQTTSVERKRTLGDVAKISLRGIHYPDIT